MQTEQNADADEWLERPEIAGLLIDPRTGEKLAHREGWLWSGNRQLHPVFNGIPIVQPQGFYKLTSLTHRIEDAHKAIETAATRGVTEVFAPKEILGCESLHAANRLDHFKDAGALFWGVVQALTQGHPENRSGWALDIGCGYGFDMISLCRSFDFVVGCDPQIDRCVMARRMLAEMGFSNFFIYCGTAEEVPLPAGRFALVTANQVVEHMADRPAAFAQVERVLRPGGQFVFALPSRYSLRPEPHVHLLLLGWLPRSLQGWYARARGRSDRYAEYTHLISHIGLHRQLRKSFSGAIHIQSGAEIEHAMSRRVPRAKRIFRKLINTPLRSFLLEFSGAMVGAASKDTF